MASNTGVKMNPKSFNKSQIKFYIMLLPIMIFMILPIIYIVSTAFKPLDELFLFPPRFLAQQPTLENFYNLFAQTRTSVPMLRYLLNSLLVTGVVLFLSVIVSSMAAYALSKLKFKGKKVLFEVNQLALMFVAATVAIPRYLVIERLGLFDTFWAHILPIVAIPVGLFLLKQFVDQIPDALIEAARIDGAGELLIFRKIILPLIKPALSTMAILAFQMIWNNIETSAFYMTSESIRTLAFYMNTLTQDVGTSVGGQGVAAAAALVMFLPNVIMFIILQSQVMDTVAHSGIK